jgi:hypothetical protein
MTVFNKKLSRMISFRLSADEYSEAMRCCQEQGIRSVSALARAATLHAIPSCAAKPIIDPEDFLAMQEQIHLLRSELSRISGLIPAPRPNAASANA